MNDLQKLGGISALIGAATYIIGFALALTMLAPILGASPEEYVAFLVDNQALLVGWHLIIYLINAVFLVVLVIALYERLKERAMVFSQIAAAFGLIWAGLVIASGMVIINDIGIVADAYSQNTAEAITIWQALSAVENGLGGAIELPGGLWILLVSIAGLQAKELSKGLNYLGIIIGIAGIVTVFPALYDGGSVFGLGFIIWFAWAGIIMLRGRANQAESGQSMPAPIHTPSI